MIVIFIVLELGRDYSSSRYLVISCLFTDMKFKSKYLKLDGQKS